jgi:protein-tyrosine sulfotransferase
VVDPRMMHMFDTPYPIQNVADVERRVRGVKPIAHEAVLRCRRRTEPRQSKPHLPVLRIAQGGIERTRPGQQLSPDNDVRTPSRYGVVARKRSNHLVRGRHRWRGDWSQAVIDVDHAAVGPVAGETMRRSQLLCEFVRRPHVVVVAEGYPFARRLRDPSVPGTADPARYGIMDDAQPGVVEANHDAWRGIGGRVVYNDDLQVDITLGQQRAKRRVEERAPVVCRNDDRYLGHGSDPTARRVSPSAGHKLLVPASMTRVRSRDRVGGPVDVSARKRPIFILGLTPRTGTNYMWDLVRLHPHCAGGREPIREDFFLEHAHVLGEFVRDVCGRWDPAWGTVSEQTVAELHSRLGTALLDFLCTDGDRRLVTKNPSVAGIERVFTFFPTAQVIILARDGRAVVESCVRTFRWDVDLATRRWAIAAATALRFLESRTADDPAVRLVRYEDLVAEPRRQVTQLLSFLDLDVAAYDFSAAERLPVRGSSIFRGGKAQVHWDPLERTSDFNPLLRWTHWTAEQHRRFAWLAGKQQIALGYGVGDAVPTTGVARARERLTSARWHVRRGVDLTNYRLRGWLGPRTRPLRERAGLTHGS